MALASARVTRFVLWDSLAGLAPDSGTRLSKRLDRFAFDEHGLDRSWWRGKVGVGLTCSWCLGGWVSLAVVCVWGWVWPWQLGRFGVVAWLAVWCVQGVLSALDHRWFVE